MYYKHNAITIMDRDTSRFGLATTSLAQNKEDDDDASRNREYHKTPSLPQPRVNSIALGVAMSTNGMDLSKNMELQLPFLTTLLPSFCQTGSSGYDYHFYIAFDHSDIFMSSAKSRLWFESKVAELVKMHCVGSFNVSLHLISCDHAGKPAWAQNDAMMQGYWDNMEYYFRLNDDARLDTPDWTEAFIKELDSRNPAGVGVVAPYHIGGNTRVYAYDFVHKTHIDIFGFYYPRVFPDWFADDWMTRLYPAPYSQQLRNVRVIHMGVKSRYRGTPDNVQYLQSQLQQDKQTVNSWLSRRKNTTNSATPKRVISYSLYGKNTKYTFGAVRNALLAPVHFPGWMVRFYLEKPTNKYLFGEVPSYIISKLKQSGAELIYISPSDVKLPPMVWRFFVADDETVERFIVRDTDSRLNARDAAAVQAWVDSAKPFHCIRDHPGQSFYPISGGLFGMLPSEVKKVFPKTFAEMLADFNPSNVYMDDMKFLKQVIWPKVKEKGICHDSVSCKQFKSDPFPLARQKYEHVGQVFDQHEQPRQYEIDILKKTPPNNDCIKNTQ